MVGTYSNRKIAIGLAVVVAVVAAIVVPTTRWMHAVTAKQDAVTARQDRIEELLTGHPPSADAGTPSPASTLFKGSGNYAFPVGPMTGTLGQGTYPAPAPASTIQWGTAVTAPTLNQASESSALKGADILIQPQQSTFAGGNTGGGNLIANMQVPTGTGNEALLEVTRGGVFNSAIGPYISAGGSFGALYLGPGITPSALNPTVIQGTGNTYLNVPGIGTINFTEGVTTNFLQLSGGLAAFYVPIGGGTAPFNFADTPTVIACGTGGSQPISAAESLTPGLIVTSGTLTSNCVLNFTTNGFNGYYILDMSGVTLGATFGVTFTNGSATKTYLSSSVLAGTLAIVWTHGANTLAVTF